MEVMTTAFMPVYIHKVVDRRIEIRYDSNGQQIRTIYETLVEELNPILIAALQMRIAELENQIKNGTANRDLRTLEWLTFYLSAGLAVSEVIKMLKN